jgi:predicted nucleic acid-binding protein
MTNKIFVDTSGWANFLISSEPFHLQTKNLMTKWQSQNVKLVTSNYVIAELVALLSSPLNVPKSLQIKIIEQMKATSWFESVF